MGQGTNLAIKRRNIKTCGSCLYLKRIARGRNAAQSPSRCSISRDRESRPDDSPNFEFQKLDSVSCFDSSTSAFRWNIGDDQLWVIQPTLAMDRQNKHARKKKRIVTPLVASKLTAYAVSGCQHPALNRDAAAELWQNCNAA